MTKKSNIELAREIADAILSDLGDRSGMLNDIDEDVMAEMKDDLDAIVFEKLETNDLG